jgi:hypothetical protein
VPTVSANTRGQVRIANPFWLVGYLCFLTLACDKEQPTPKQGQPPSAPRPVRLAVLGDATRLGLVQDLAQASEASLSNTDQRVSVVITHSNAALQVVAARSEELVEDAKLASSADGVIIAVDATQGPLPVHRERILLARQLSVPQVVICLTKTSLVDDEELLELEELEMRELLNRYEWPGDTAPCCYDHTRTKTSSRFKVPQGPEAMLTTLAAIAPKHASAEARIAGRRFKASVYALHPQEVYSSDVAIPIRAGSADMLLADRQFRVELRSAATVAGGQVGDVELEFPTDLEVYAGQRFVLLNRNHVAAAGSFMLPMRQLRQLPSRDGRRH